MCCLPGHHAASSSSTRAASVTMLLANTKLTLSTTTNKTRKTTAVSPSSFHESELFKRRGSHDDSFSTSSSSTTVPSTLEDSDLSESSLEGIVLFQHDSLQHGIQNAITRVTTGLCKERHRIEQRLDGLATRFRQQVSPPRRSSSFSPSNSEATLSFEESRLLRRITRLEHELEQKTRECQDLYRQVDKWKSVALGHGIVKKPCSDDHTELSSQEKRVSSPSSCSSSCSFSESMIVPVVPKTQQQADTQSPSTSMQIVKAAKRRVSFADDHAHPTLVVPSSAKPRPQQLLPSDAAAPLRSIVVPQATSARQSYHPMTLCSWNPPVSTAPSSPLSSSTATLQQIMQTPPSWLSPLQAHRLGHEHPSVSKNTGSSANGTLTAFPPLFTSFCSLQQSIATAGHPKTGGGTPWTPAAAAVMATSSSRSGTKNKSWERTPSASATVPWFF